GAQGSGHPERRSRREPLGRRDRELFLGRHVLRDRSRGQECQGDARRLLPVRLRRPQGGARQPRLRWWALPGDRWPHGPRAGRRHPRLGPEERPRRQRPRSHPGERRRGLRGRAL
ncbi:MAG: Histone protein Lsr2, partial [uncultured Blastococcus sp.]